MKTKSPAQFSYEFFPPRTPVMERRLWRAMGQLERLDPLFYSMTYGALGSGQSTSVDTALAMHRESPVPVAAHLTAADADADGIERVAKTFYDAGIRSIVALRGDSVDGGHYGFASTVELVERLAAWPDLDISVAAYPEVHPEAESADADLRHLKRKLDAGASRAITQYFFDADVFLRFRDRAQAIGIDQPIVPGILPVHDIDKVEVFSQRCGATVPRQLRERFEVVGDDEQARHRLAVDLAVELCDRLIAEGVDHLHLYTLNRTDLSLDISLALGASLRHAA